MKPFKLAIFALAASLSFAASAQNPLIQRASAPTPPVAPYTTTINPSTLPAVPAIYLGMPVIVEFLGNIPQPGYIQFVTSIGYVGTTPMPEQVVFWYTTGMTDQACSIFQTKDEATAAYAFGGVGACVGWPNLNLL